jgi:hypothetical protein
MLLHMQVAASKLNLHGCNNGVSTHTSVCFMCNFLSPGSHTVLGPLLSLPGVQGYVLHCPDCGHKSQELLTQQAVLQHIQQHLSTEAAAAGSPSSTLQAALDAGRYRSAAVYGFAPDHPADMPAEPDDDIQELMAQIITVIALHIIVATRPENGPTKCIDKGKHSKCKQAPLPVPPPGTEGSLAGEVLAAQAVLSVADGSRCGTEQRCRQQRQRLRRLLLP